MSCHFSHRTVSLPSPYLYWTIGEEIGGTYHASRRWKTREGCHHKMWYHGPPSQEG